jgi:TonB family protein
VLDGRVLESSGRSGVDQELLSSVRSQVLPKPPPEVQGNDLWIEIPLSFK